MSLEKLVMHINGANSTVIKYLFYYIFVFLSSFRLLSENEKNKSLILRKDLKIWSNSMKIKRKY